MFSCCEQRGDSWREGPTGLAGWLREKLAQGGDPELTCHSQSQLPRAGYATKTRGPVFKNAEKGLPKILKYTVCFFSSVVSPLACHGVFYLLFNVTLPWEQGYILSGGVKPPEGPGPLPHDSVSVSARSGKRVSVHACVCHCVCWGG